tara:strand:+ start:648 stop:1247 length:600 start_codon:yes stop_codon:yes gene_type:complete
MELNKMTNLNKTDLLSLEEYSERREGLRSEVLQLKKDRLIQIGENISLLFESIETIKYQIQEMLRIEKIFDADGIEEELAAYNPLIPDGTNLKATMLIEYPDRDIRAEKLKDLHLVENKVWLQIGENERVYAVADEDLERSNEEKTSAVHFLRFEFDKNMIEDFKSTKMLYAGIDHPKYNIKTKETPLKTIESLAADFS